MGQVAAQGNGSGGSRPALLLCGDLNSDLNEGIPGARITLCSQRLLHCWKRRCHGAIVSVIALILSQCDLC